jgi:probable rRNA maturation factor
MKAAKKNAMRARASQNRNSASTPALRVSVQYATRSRSVPTRGRFRKWIGAALDAEARITVRVMDSREGRALNRSYRGKDYATNVLTFVMNGEPPYEGDLALCAPVISREAREQGKELAAHYAHLTVHGVLHLQGYEHETNSDAIKMERLETRILQRLGYSDPYAALAHHG